MEKELHIYHLFLRLCRLTKFLWNPSGYVNCCVDLVWNDVLQSVRNVSGEVKWRKMYNLLHAHRAKEWGLCSLMSLFWHINWLNSDLISLALVSKNPEPVSLVHGVQRMKWHGRQKGWQWWTIDCSIIILVNCVVLYCSIKMLCQQFQLLEQK
jgi:hypothetical protein